MVLALHLCAPPPLPSSPALLPVLASLPLSIFGRGIASAAYGVSKLLYHAEFTGHPPPAAGQELTDIETGVFRSDAARNYHLGPSRVDIAYQA